MGDYCPPSSSPAVLFIAKATEGSIRPRPLRPLFDLFILGLCFFILPFKGKAALVLANSNTHYKG